MAISLRLGSSLTPPPPVSLGRSKIDAPFRVSFRLHWKFPLLMICSAFKPASWSLKRETTGTGVMKPRRVSMEMREFLGGVPEIARGQVVKEIWSYVKLHNLQDPNDKKLAHCDEKLKRILGGRDQFRLELNSLNENFDCFDNSTVEAEAKTQEDGLWLHFLLLPIGYAVNKENYLRNQDIYLAEPHSIFIEVRNALTFALENPPSETASPLGSAL